MLSMFLFLLESTNTYIKKKYFCITATHLVPNEAEIDANIRVSYLEVISWIPCEVSLAKF